MRGIAERYGLPNARKPDSQDICFVPDGDYAGFLESVMGVGASPGDFVDKDGRVLGKHKGHHRYTIGQRKGLGVSFGEPRYVIGKDAKSNTVTLGDMEQLCTREFETSEVNWISIEKLY